jgi:uncharacterized protein with HEPN domain
LRDYSLYIKDILAAIDSIEQFVDDMDFTAFKEDDKTSSAVVRKFEIIGEASKNIPDEIRLQYSDIPWKEMSGMRDKLIHFYFGVDHNLVWTAIQNRLPKIKAVLIEIAK